MAEAQFSRKPSEDESFAERFEHRAASNATDNEPWRNSTIEEHIGEGVSYREGPGQIRGLHVSPDLNDKIDPIWRDPNGWYEGAQRWAIVAIHLPDRFENKDVETAHVSAKTNYPEAYREFTSNMFATPDRELGYDRIDNYHGEGISLFETPIDTHLHVSQELNAKIDPAWRAPDGRYDVENQASIVALSFPERFDPSELEAARQDAKDRHPEIYEKVIGQMAPPSMDDDDNLTTSPETSVSKPAPDLKDLLAAFDRDTAPVGNAPDKDALSANDTETEEKFEVTVFGDDSVMLSEDIESVDELYIAQHDGIHSKQSYTRSQAESLGLDVSSAAPIANAGIANSAGKPNPDLKDLIAVFDSDLERSGKTAEATDANTVGKPGIVDAQADFMPAPVAATATEERVVTTDKHHKPFTADNSNPADTKTNNPATSTQSGSAQASRNEQQPNDWNRQPVTANVTAAGVLAASLANAFRRTPSEAVPQATEPDPKEPAPSSVQPPQDASAAKPETPAPAAPAAPTNSAVHGPSNPVGGSLALRNLLTGFRPARSESIAAQDARPPAADNSPAQPGSARALLDKFDRSRMQPRRDADQLQATERAAATAVSSFQALEKADSSAILTRIREAAEASPGGMKEVLSEMKPGGAYEDLRKEFNAALSRDENFSAAYETASSALDAYADQREKVAPILQKGNTGVLARLENLDQQINKAGSDVPGKEAGKSALDEALEKGGQALSQAIDAVRNAFSRQGPSAGPSISP